MSTAAKQEAKPDVKYTERDLLLAKREVAFKMLELYSQYPKELYAVEVDRIYPPPTRVRARREQLDDVIGFTRFYVVEDDTLKVWSSITGCPVETDETSMPRVKRKDDVVRLLKLFNTPTERVPDDGTVPAA